MFRAVLCSSSGGQIVLLPYLVSSLSVDGRTVKTLSCCWESNHYSLSWRDWPKP